MTFVQLIILLESAHRTITYLRELDLLQFKDVKLLPHNPDPSPSTSATMASHNSNTSTPTSSTNASPAISGSSTVALPAATVISNTSNLISIKLDRQPHENQHRNRHPNRKVAVTTTFYMLCGCMGYAAFGDGALGNLLTGFGFYNPYWLPDIANAAIVLHLVGAYQVFCQPLFTLVEKWFCQQWPDSDFITKEYPVRLLPRSRCCYSVNPFRLVWRTAFVIVTTVISMILPFFNDVVSILGAFGFWPLTVYFPVEMYISQKKIPRWSTRWVGLDFSTGTGTFAARAAARQRRGGGGKQDSPGDHNTQKWCMSLREDVFSGFFAWGGEVVHAVFREGSLFSPMLLGKIFDPADAFPL
ncbi:hypothetical protein Taro_018912 [Colocasia esculenta]|uniref:Amino acid transporter transmembrane domain-containing protein n=1 Tax=Colocasia esculenta TaxID=4460 RepID=A0A843V3W3_COLES|nr:hypothetical protein [Colocasia esculenta]